MKIKNLHRWDVSPREAVAVQRRLQKMIRTDGFSKEICFVAGADAAFSKENNLIHGAVSVFSFPHMELAEVRTSTLPLRFPYIPGLLSFREGPVLLECFRKMKIAPDVIIFDGQGIMHPRKMGIAAHLGILLDTSSIGCAKSYLYGEFKIPSNRKGAHEYVKDKKGEIIGACLRTRTDVKPVFVSVGHKIGLLRSMDIILRCTKRYRIPEPLRHAHRTAEAL